MGYPSSTRAPPTAAALKFLQPRPPDTMAEPVVEPKPVGEELPTETDELPPPPRPPSSKPDMKRPCLSSAG